MRQQLEKCLASERKNPTILDVVLYGSAARTDESRDIDVIVLFKEGTLRQRLDMLAHIKSKIRHVLPDRSLDLKQVLLAELFDPAFMARQGILVDGYSLLHGAMFCERMGFRSYALFAYSLSGLTHAQKVRFNYILAGRGMTGMLERVKGVRLAGGAIKVPQQAANIFEGILRRTDSKKCGRS